MERKVMLPWSRLSVMTVVFAALVLTVGSAGATVIRVPADYPKVQLAINAASSTDTVLVAAGRYAPSTNGESFPILMKNGVRLIGAGAPVCTLDAERTQRVMLCRDISDTFTRVEGFTLTKGQYNAYGGGGGIKCEGASPIITSNVIVGNKALRYRGGGIYCYYSSPTITNNVITGNSAGAHAGIYCARYSSPTISNNIVTGNNAMYCGGIKCHYFSHPTITNNVITGNSGSEDTGGIGCSYLSSPSITNNVITGNSGGSEGGGIHCHYASPTITNNVITDNSAHTGGGIHCEHYSYPGITYNDVWNNPGGNYSGCSPGTGCISADPLFVDPAADDFHLQSGSPCIDAGNNNAPGLPEFDFDGKPRILDGNGDGIAVVDMGAYEYQISVIEAIVDFDPDKLNFASKGKWVTCYIELPLPHSAEDIDPNTVALTKIDGTELNPPLYREGPTGVGDYDEDGIADLMVKFDRQELIAILKSMGYDDGDVVELTVAGELTTGEAFEGSDVIEVLNKGMKDEPDEGGILSSGPLGGGGSSIEYTLPEASQVQIVIYDPLGRKVITLLEEYQDAGSHSITWDGRNASGEPLPAGVYFLKFKAGEFSHKARVVILR